MNLRTAASSRISTVCLGIAGLLFPLESAESGDWPHWRGPDRNDVSDEASGWDGSRWLNASPAWTARVGEGSTSPLVVDGRLYTVGWRDGRDRVVCLHARTGQALWSQAYRCPRYGRHSRGDKGLYSGPTSTPEYDRETGYLYTLSVDGHLNCWDTGRRGEHVWGFNLYDRYQVEQRPKLTRIGHRDYGYTTAPLVQGDHVIVEVGDDTGNLMGFDKRTGKRRWTSENDDPAGHTGGPVPLKVEGVPCVAVLTLKRLLVVRLDEGRRGETVAEHRWTTDYGNNTVTPAVQDGSVLITSGYNHARLCRLKLTLEGARVLWERPYYSKTCTPVIADGHVYWVRDQLHCLDFATGRLLWRGGRYGRGGSCVATADDRLIVLGSGGNLALAETARRRPDAYEPLAELDDVVPATAWPHVVLAEGRLYCKDRRGTLTCFQR